jgi:hypothetical protein
MDGEGCGKVGEMEFRNEITSFGAHNERRVMIRLCLVG